MGAVSLSMRAEAFRLTWARRGGNAEQVCLGGGKFCRKGSNCRGEPGSPEVKKPTFYRLSRDGTGFADQSA
jgi:hypothetical protein